MTTDKCEIDVERKMTLGEEAHRMAIKEIRAADKEAIAKAIAERYIAIAKLNEKIAECKDRIESHEGAIKDIVEGKQDKSLTYAAHLDLKE